MTATPDATHKPKNKSCSGIFRSKDPDACTAEYHARMIASAAGLPRLCHIKKCRQRRRCFGAYTHPDLPCIERHEGLFRARFTRALACLGWSMDGREQRAEGRTSEAATERRTTRREEG